MSDESLTWAQARGIRAWLESDYMSSPLSWDLGSDNEPEVPWLLLSEGDRVQVRRQDHILVGTVDCIMADATIFWIWQDGGAGRVAVYEEDDVTVTLI